MEDLSDDESFVLILAAIGAAVAAVRWYVPLLTRRPAPVPLARLSRGILAAAPALGLALLYPVLRLAAAHDVRDNPLYLALFLFAGTFFISAGPVAAHLLGISARHDALDRNNPAAAIAVAGAMTGLAIAYAGANVGEGATIWTTFGPAALGSAIFLSLWLAVEIVARVSDAIAVDRDAASALRLAGLHVASGLILFRAAAGDYQSVAGTVADFARLGWPLIPIAVATAVMQRHWAPSPTCPHPPVLRRGAFPAAALIAAALILTAIASAAAQRWAP